MSVAAINMHRPEPTKGRVERTTLGITAINIPIRPGSLFCCCYKFIIRPICCRHDRI